MNLVKMNVSDPTPTNSPKDFKAQVIINNHLGTVLVDARAKASAFGPIQTNVDWLRNCTLGNTGLAKKKKLDP